MIRLDNTCDNGQIYHPLASMTNHSHSSESFVSRPNHCTFIPRLTANKLYIHPSFKGQVLYIHPSFKGQTIVPSSSVSWPSNYTIILRFLAKPSYLHPPFSGQTIVPSSFVRWPNNCTYILRFQAKPLCLHLSFPD